MMTNHDAYDLASEVDVKINNQMRSHPPNHENWSQWLLYVRTIQTSLDVVSHDIELQRLRSMHAIG